jgi:hypothetical protein
MCDFLKVKIYLPKLTGSLLSTPIETTSKKKYAFIFGLYESQEYTVHLDEYKNIEATLQNLTCNFCTSVCKVKLRSKSIPSFYSFRVVKMAKF